MGRFMAEVVIAAPAERVFAALIDFNNAPRLMSGIGEIQLMTPGALRKGSRIRETRTIQGRTETVDCEVSEFEPDRRYAVRNETGGVEIVYRYDVQSQGNDTRVEFNCEVNGRGLKKLLVPIIVRVLKKEDGRHLESLKELVEG